MRKLLLVSIILLNFSSIFSQEYKILLRSRDWKYALLQNDQVIIPYQKGTIFFLRGQGREVTELGSLNKYYPLMEFDSGSIPLVAVYNENRLAAIFDIVGQQLSDYCYSFDEDYRLGDIHITRIEQINQQMSKYGFTPVSFYGNSTVFPPDKNPYNVKCSGSKGFLSYTGELLFEPVYDYISFSFEEYEKTDSDRFLVWFKRQGVIGIRDLWGKELVNFSNIDKIENIYTGEGYPKLNNKSEVILLTRVEKRNDTKYGLLKIDLNNFATKVILKSDYDRIENLAKGNGGMILKAIKNGKIALINSKFEVINKLKIDEVTRFTSQNKYFIIKSNGKYGLIDFNGEIILEPEYDQFEDFPQTNYVIIRKKNKYGVLLLTTKKISEIKYDYAGFEYLKDRFGYPNGVIITIKIFGKTDYENDKIGKITKNLEEVWSNWKEADINLKNK
jgi:hypothetical protein